MFSEKKAEQRLRRKAHQLNGTCDKLVSPGNSGAVDRIVKLPFARIWFVELKSEGKTPDPLQVIYMDDLVRMGFKVRWINNEKALHELFEEMELI